MNLKDKRLKDSLEIELKDQFETNINTSSFITIATFSGTRFVHEVDGKIEYCSDPSEYSFSDAAAIISDHKETVWLQMMLIERTVGLAIKLATAFPVPPEIVQKIITEEMGP
ncbi:MAG: hypothetical protein GY799_12200 [Desulfobulbaceae bacterium]|nr:hypothetical protein [Desulfobulbaceae bacterium]